MPYSPDNPPDKLKGLSGKKQRQWVEVFNSCWDKHHDDGKCHAMAWGVVKKGASMNITGARLPSAVERKLKEIEDMVSDFYDENRSKGRQFSEYIRCLMLDDDPHRWDYKSIEDLAPEACDDLRMARDEQQQVLDQIGAILWGRTASRMARIASRVAQAALEGQRGARVAGSFLDDVRAVKMKAAAMDFLQEVKDFKGGINTFLKEMTSAVKNPKALAAFPEIRDVIELSEFLKKGVLRHTFLSESDLTQKMQKVVELDA